MLEDDINAAPVGNALHFLRDLLLVVIDSVVGAELAGFLQLALVTRRGDDLGAQHLADLDRRRTHA